MERWPRGGLSVRRRRVATGRVGHASGRRPIDSRRFEVELSRLGGGVEVEGDALDHSGTARAAEIETYDDHRMAMSFALAGLRIDGVVIRIPECVSKTWPEYFEALEAMCRA
jgi:5-enolpyruvylshikimate-3-phosphate synthase